MAIQTVPYGYPFPVWPTKAGNSTPALSAGGIMDAAGEKAAMIYAASAAKAIRKIHVRTATVTTGAALDMRVETVDAAANGDPTGTLWAVNTNGALVIDAADDNVWKVVTLTADATLAVGDVFALVAVAPAGANIHLAQYSGVGLLMPYASNFTSVWTKNTSPTLIIPEYSDGSFEPALGLTDVGGPVNTTTFNSGSATNRRGNVFQVPFPCRVKGCWVWADLDGDCTVVLYDSDGVGVLATTPAINRFQRGATAGSIHFYLFTAPATLVKDTVYRIAIVPSSVTDLSTYDFDVPVAAMLDRFPGGQSCHSSVFTTGAWVETTTQRHYLGVFLDGFDDGVGAARIFGSPIFGG